MAFTCQMVFDCIIKSLVLSRSLLSATLISVQRSLMLNRRDPTVVRTETRDHNKHRSISGSTDGDGSKDR